MTRETKIGLLVGLAFLLVVGILLSEHITGATERPAAPLADAGHTLARGVDAPGAGVAEPQQPVPTPADLTPKPAVSPAVPQPIAVLPPAPAADAVVPPAKPAGTVVVHAPTDPFANLPVAKVAKEMGEPVVPVAGSAKTRPAPIVVPATLTSPAGTTPAHEYKAQAGDTLSRLASQVPGGNTKGNRDAVVKLNPSLQSNPNRVLSGHTYLLPTTAGPATITVASAPAPPAAPAVTDKAASDGRTYVVKAGDTLSRIASSELGSKTELPTLRKLNADVLKGSDVIKVDMKLKLPPGRALASLR